MLKKDLETRRISRIGSLICAASLICRQRQFVLTRVSLAGRRDLAALNKRRLRRAISRRYQDGIKKVSALTQSHRLGHRLREPSAVRTVEPAPVWTSCGVSIGE
jgi:hypothetical protein